MRHIPANHVAHNGVFGDLLRARIHAGNGRPVTNDSDAVSDATHLIELVTDDDAGHALCLQLKQQIQQRLTVAFRQCCRWLVEDQQSHFFGQRLGNLDQLLLTHAQFADQCCRCLAQANFMQQFFCPPKGAMPVDNPARGLLVAQEQVFRDRQKRHKCQFLMNDDNATFLAVGYVAELGQTAGIVNFTLVTARRIHTGQNFHQC